MKKLLCTLMAIMLLTMGFAFAETTDEAGIANQYYAYSFTAEGYGDYSFFFHFYEDDPVLGAVYYAGLSNNRINFAGLYTVEKADYEYACYADRQSVVNAQEKLTGTAPYTIHFYDWNGNEIDTCGWDGEILYNDCTTITGSGSGPVLYAHDTEGKYQDAYDNEQGMPYLDFVAVDDVTATVSLCHNKTYIDMMMYFIDGTWTIADGENGASVYTFTPFDDFENVVTLTVSADQKTAVYTDAYGDETEMVNAAADAPKAVYGGEAFYHVNAYNADATVALTLYDDDTCDIIATIFGNSAEIDKGTYTMNADHSISFNFDNVGDLTANLDMSVMGVVLNYANANTRLGAMELSFAIGRLEAEAVPEAEIILSFKGGYTTFDVLSDGTYKFEFASYGIVETGTWTFQNYQFSITQSNGNVITATLDADYNMSFEYTAEANPQLKDTFTAARNDWGQALVK